MFEESKHPRDKDGKFTTKGNEGNKEYRQNTSYNEILKKQKLEDKFNSELPGKPNKSSLTKQEWALWYKAVAENKKLGYWVEELPNGGAVLKVENNNSHKLVITSGPFEKPKVDVVYSFSNSDEMNDYIEVLKKYE